MSRIVVIPDAVSMSLLPRIARDDNGRAELTALCARICWWMTAVVFLLWVAVSTPLTRVLLSEAFLPVVPMTWIMGVGFVAYSGAGVFMSYFRGINRPGVCSWAMWIGLCANVLAFLALYATLGLTGMAWAIAVGLVMRTLYLVWMFSHVSGMSWWSALFPRRGDALYLADAGLSVLRGVRSST